MFGFWRKKSVFEQTFSCFDKELSAQLEKLRSTFREVKFEENKSMMKIQIFESLEDFEEQNFFEFWWERFGGVVKKISYKSRRVIGGKKNFRKST